MTEKRSTPKVVPLDIEVSAETVIDGTEKVCERVLITAKGLTKLAKIFELQQAA